MLCSARILGKQPLMFRALGFLALTHTAQEKAIAYLLIFSYLMTVWIFILVAKCSFRKHLLNIILYFILKPFLRLI